MSERTCFHFAAVAIIKQACACKRTSGNCVGEAGRALAILPSGRHLRGIRFEIISGKSSPTGPTNLIIINMVAAVMPLRVLFRAERIEGFDICDRIVVTA